MVTWDSYHRHIDYIHYNAVKNGYVKRPIDWPYSTFQKCIEEGGYTFDWGGVVIDAIEIDDDW